MFRECFGCKFGIETHSLKFLTYNLGGLNCSSDLTECKILLDWSCLNCRPCNCVVESKGRIYRGSLKLITLIAR